MFDSKVSVQVHFAVKHSNERRLFKCKVCNESWENDNDFKNHIKMAHLSQLSAALSPPTSASNSPSDAASIASSLPHPGLLFPGLFPPSLFMSKDGAAPGFFKCRFCPAEFNVEFLLDRHVEAEHQHLIMNSFSSSSSGSNTLLRVSVDAEQKEHKASSCLSPLSPTDGKPIIVDG